MRKEFLAGLSTFFTASYLILLYPKIFSEGGMDFGSVLTATILVIFIATSFLALYSDFPVLLVPGLSVGAYLIYSVVLKRGGSWELALGLVFWTGVIIFLLSIFKVRQKILVHLPNSIKSAAIGGIGLFLICVGLKNLILTNSALFTAPNGIALFGLILFFSLYYFRVPGLFLITILACWILAIPFGYVHWEGAIALPASLSPTLFKLDFLSPFKLEWLGTLLSVTLICLFDTSASLTVLSKLAHRIDPYGRIKNVDQIVIPDGPGSCLAALLGTGTLAFTLESSAGLNAGGRTKMTAITAATCCLGCLFFYPALSSIPLFASSPVIIAIGYLMTKEILTIRWKVFTESIPSLIILFVIPITFSIYWGFALGFMSYVLLKAFRKELRDVHPVCWVLALIFAAHLVWSLFRI